MSSVEISRPSGDRSLKDLISDLRHSTGLLVRQEIALAKATVVKTAVTFGVAGLLAGAVLDPLARSPGAVILPAALCGISSAAAA